MPETVTLAQGLDKEGVPQTEAVLRAVKAGDILDASMEAERVVQTPDGYQLVSSPALAGFALLGRQIERIGDIQGPISLAMLRRFTDRDLALLQAAAQRLEDANATALAQEAARTGRGAGPAATR